MDYDKKKEYISELENFIRSMIDFMEESTGVVGFHLNGAIATWQELGFIEEACDLLDKGKQLKDN